MTTAIARRTMAALLLVALVAVTYAPVRHFGFVNLDDPENVSDEPHVAAGLTADGLWWAVTGRTMGHWVPLTRLTYLLDRRWCHLNPGVMHVEDVALHAATVVVLFLWLAEMTGSAARSGAVAAVFAVHPVLVESVAWITERRDVLSTPLLLGSMWAYVRYARADRPGRRWAAYGASLGLYGLSLSAKAMGMTAPVLLLLLDAWPLGRLPGPGRPGRSGAWRRVLLEKGPFLALAVPVAALAVYAQAAGGMARTLDLLPVSDRAANALVSTVAYVAKLAVPRRLAVMYLPPMDGWPGWRVLGAAVAVVAVGGTVVRFRRRWPYLAFGVGWFAVTLLPVSGAVQSGPQSMADRYMYVPAIGLFVAAVWAVGDGLNAVAARRPAVRRFVPATALALAASVVAGLAVAGRVQVGYWRNTRTLFAHAVAVTDDNWFADYNLGMAAAQDRDLKTAIDSFGRALTVYPDCAPALDGLAMCVLQFDRVKAMPLFLAAVEQNPRDATAWANLGYGRLALHQPTAAADEDFARALELDPTLSDVRRDRAALAHGSDSRAGLAAGRP